MFNVLCLLQLALHVWESVSCVAIEAVTAVSAAAAVVWPVRLRDMLLLLLLLTVVFPATAAVVVLGSLPPAAAGSGAVFGQKTVYESYIAAVVRDRC